RRRARQVGRGGADALRRVGVVAGQVVEAERQRLDAVVERQRAVGRTGAEQLRRRATVERRRLDGVRVDPAVVRIGLRARGRGVRELEVLQGQRELAEV